MSKIILTMEEENALLRVAAWVFRFKSDFIKAERFYEASLAYFDNLYNHYIACNSFLASPKSSLPLTLGLGNPLVREDFFYVVHSNAPIFQLNRDAYSRFWHTGDGNELFISDVRARYDGGNYNPFKATLLNKRKIRDIWKWSYIYLATESFHYMLDVDTHIGARVLESLYSATAKLAYSYLENDSFFYIPRDITYSGGRDEGDPSVSYANILETYRRIYRTLVHCNSTLPSANLDYPIFVRNHLLRGHVSGTSVEHRSRLIRFRLPAYFAWLEDCTRLIENAEDRVRSVVATF